MVTTQELWQTRWWWTSSLFVGRFDSVVNLKLSWGSNKLAGKSVCSCSKWRGFQKLQILFTCMCEIYMPHTALFSPLLCSCHIRRRELSPGNWHITLVTTLDRIISNMLLTVQNADNVERIYPNDVLRDSSPLSRRGWTVSKIAVPVNQLRLWHLRLRWEDVTFYDDQLRASSRDEIGLSERSIRVSICCGVVHEAISCSGITWEVRSCTEVNGKFDRTFGEKRRSY